MDEGLAPRASARRRETRRLNANLEKIYWLGAAQSGSGTGHCGLGAVRAGDGVLDDSFRDEAVRSRGFFPLAGDLRLTSEVEDLDLPNSVRLREPGALEDALVSPSCASADAGVERASPLFGLSPPPASLPCPFCLHVLSEAFFTSALLFPRSAERRLSLWRRALLKNDMPFSSALLPRCCSLVEALGERRLVTEELLLELRISLLSARQPSPLLASGDRAAGPPLRPSTVGLVCIESLLKLLSSSFLRPLAALFSDFLAAGEGEAGSCGVERMHGLCRGVASAGGGVSFFLEGVPAGVEVLFLSLLLLAFFPLTGVLEDDSEALRVAHRRLLGVFSCSPLLAFLLELVLSAFEAKPPMLLLRFCSLGAVPWAATAFWSIAVTWLLFSVASCLPPFFSSGVGARQYITSMKRLPSGSLPLLSMVDKGDRLPK